MRKFGLFLASAIFIYASFIALSNNDHAVSEHQYVETVVFVHGFKGNANSFNTMIARFEEYGWGSRALTINVTKTGRLLVQKDTSLPDKPAFIQVLFENNRASFDDTSHALASVMQALKKEYGIDHVNIVSHSMGGIVSVKFLQELYDPLRHPVTDKLVTIGSPFDGVAGGRWFTQNTGPAVYDLMPGSPALAQLVAGQTHFPTETDVLNIAGIGDQVTPVQSALRLKAIVPKKNYRLDIIYDKTINHSGLHETPIVDKKIGHFFSYK